MVWVVVELMGYADVSLRVELWCGLGRSLGWTCRAEAEEGRMRAYGKGVSTWKEALEEKTRDVGKEGIVL